ncbi:hypothetical protein Pse7367_0095 [Thalassoporum mexicanum PCC 7367]|uniref:DUF2996 domain-containing protein n=1 Tax=Thalassoporum mexicanum TaxID=3457544 RepID=UPI00029FD68B|nr:DUF2996 domain-containing protein [Pseudanabaena sp. PCC 7367]AFY68413.1 hypothetical protein Pse7367_0095 [Pseudanabaena sp. PCC 7367]
MAEEKTAKKAKPEKPPEPEELPFEQFINEHYLPSLAKALAEDGLSDLQLQFDNGQVRGKWLGNQRQFTVYFAIPDIGGQKAFSCADRGFEPATIEPFMVDERKTTLDLLVFYVQQRLNGQKWLAPN